MIDVVSIEKRFGKNHALRGVDMAIREGCITAVLGPNGSGKTTLIRSILGMVIPGSGEILSDGRSISNRWDYRAGIGYLPQSARFPENLKVRELLNMITDIRGTPSDEKRLLNMFDLEGLVDRPLRHLSGGTRQKVNITLTFMFDMPCYILDEPTAGLDPLSMVRFYGLLREQRQKGKAILLTTHIMSLVEELADEIVFLLEGRIYFNGSLSEILAGHGGKNLEEAIANILSENKNA